MKYLYCVLFTFCVLHTISGQYYEFNGDDDEYFEDVRLELRNDTERECTRPGLLCKNCNTLVNCVEGNAGEFEEQEIETCQTSLGQTCFNNKCTTDPNPPCTNYKFECTGTGVFPDPYDCRKFHYCVVKRTGPNAIDIEDGQEGKVTLLCDSKHGFDPVTTYCKINLPNGCSETNFPVPICKTPGQTGPLSNKSIYYVCGKNSDNKLEPKLYVCPNGKTFQNNKCI